MGFPLQSPGARHHVTRVLGMTTLQLTAAAEDTNTIAVTAQLSDIDGNSIASADAWVAEIVGEPAADYTCAETGDGTALNVTGHTSCAFTLSAAGLAEITVTDVSGASGEDVVLAFRPLDSFGEPAYIVLTFD